MQPSRTVGEGVAPGAAVPAGRPRLRRDEAGALQEADEPPRLEVRVEAPVADPLEGAELERAVERPAGDEGPADPREDLRQLARRDVQEGGAGPYPVEPAEGADSAEVQGHHVDPQALGGDAAHPRGRVRGHDVEALPPEGDGVPAGAAPQVEHARPRRQSRGEPSAGLRHVGAERRVEVPLGVGVVERGGRAGHARLEDASTALPIQSLSERACWCMYEPMAFPRTRPSLRPDMPRPRLTSNP